MIWVEVDSRRIQGTKENYCLEEQTYEICHEICFDSEVEWTWKRDVSRAAKYVGQRCRSWWVNDVELASIHNS